MSSVQWIIREKLADESRFHAGSKARQDVDTILTGHGMQPITISVAPADRNTEGKLQKIARHLTASRRWKSGLGLASSGDTVLVQFPTVYFCPGLHKVLAEARDRGVKLVCVVHDLVSLREIFDASSTGTKRGLLGEEEVRCLKCFDRIVVHNSHMKNWITEHLKIADANMVSLEIFDYLYPEGTVFADRERDTVVIAGNLAREKAGYVYHLPEHAHFRLYGVNYDQNHSGIGHIEYEGAFLPDILPGKLRGGFGLVWDGPNPDTCFGSFMGEYLQYNNPHKTSLYLAAGLPVIIWEKAAMADFVCENHCGVCISGLQEIPDVIEQISAEKYEKLKAQAEVVAKRLRVGKYTLQAMDKCGLM